MPSRQLSKVAQQKENRPARKRRFDRVSFAIRVGVLPAPLEDSVVAREKDQENLALERRLLSPLIRAAADMVRRILAGGSRQRDDGKTG
jgi:hypothetical protein